MAAEESERCFSGGCEAEVASSFEQVAFEGRSFSRTIPHKKNHHSANIHIPPFRSYGQNSGMATHFGKLKENRVRADFLDLSEECRHGRTKETRRSAPLVSRMYRTTIRLSGQPTTYRTAI